MRKVLGAADPLIDGWAHYAHCLLMIQNKKESYDWIYSNFISFFLGDMEFCGGFELRVDFDFPPVSIGLFDKCSCLGVNRRNRAPVIESREKLLDYVCNELENNFYVHMFIDHKYITSFSTNNHYHDALIYGIDTDEGKVYLADVFEKGQYEKKEITLDEFVNAALGCILTDDEDYMGGTLETYKVVNYPRKVSMKGIRESLKMYYESRIPDFWRMFEQEQLSRYTFGLDVYAALSKRIKEVVVNNPYVDPRLFVLIQEHKEIMYKRFEYFVDNGYCTEDVASPIIDCYKKLSKMANGLVMNTLVFNQKHSEKLIDKMSEEIDKMHEMERTCLENYLSITE